MFPHTAWIEGAHRANRYRNEADVHRALASAGLASPTRLAAARVLHGTAAALVRIAERIVPSHVQPAASPRTGRRPPVASA
jgi:hypothetical protein